MGSFRDNAHVQDVLSAGLTHVRTEPIYPCPDCGAETRVHGEAPRETSTERICSSATCKMIQPAMTEVQRVTPNDQRPRFPCAGCGRETKVHKSGRTGETTKRICVRPSCQRIIETAH